MIVLLSSWQQRSKLGAKWRNTNCKFSCLKKSSRKNGVFWARSALPLSLSLSPFNYVAVVVGRLIIPGRRAAAAAPSRSRGRQSPCSTTVPCCKTAPPTWSESLPEKGKFVGFLRISTALETRWTWPGRAPRAPAALPPCTYYRVTRMVMEKFLLILNLLIPLTNRAAGQLQEQPTSQRNISQICQQNLFHDHTCHPAS